jgi:hypothetical protein
VEAICFSKKSADFHQTVQHCIPEDINIHTDRSENLRSTIFPLWSKCCKRRRSEICSSPFRQRCSSCMYHLYSTKIHTRQYLNLEWILCMNRDSDWRRTGRLRGQSTSPGRVRNFLFSSSSRPALGPIHLPIQWVPGALSLVVKRPERKADHSPPTSVEVKKTWIYTSTPPYVFMA